VQLHEGDGKAGRRGFGARDAGKGSGQAMDVDDDQSRRDSLSNIRCVSWGTRHRPPPAYEAMRRSSASPQGVATPGHVRPECVGCHHGNAAEKAATRPLTLRSRGAPQLHPAVRTVTEALSLLLKG